MTCAFEPTEGRFVASGGLDNTVSLYHVAVGEEAEQAQDEDAILLRGHEGYVSCCQFLSPQQVLSSSGDTTVILWDVGTQQVTMQKL